MWKPDICIYHADCLDGFGAAWAIWKRWGNDIAYVPGTYGKPLPDVAGKNVLFVDFSAKRAEIEAMAQIAKSIVIIDHHKTAEADLEPFNLAGDEFTKFWANGLHIDLFPERVGTDRAPVLAWFDMKQSGALMAWKFVFPELEVPKFLSYIEDRDLWRFKFGDRTRQFAAALRTYATDFQLWDHLALNIDRLVDEGQGIVRAHRHNVDKFLGEAYWDKIDGHLVPIVNVPYHYASDVGNALLKRFPEAPFAATWCKRGDRIDQYSLRSEDSRLDVGAIAASLGGGGHRNAAGFQIS